MVNLYHREVHRCAVEICILFAACGSSQKAPEPDRGSQGHERLLGPIDVETRRQLRSCDALTVLNQMTTGIDLRWCGELATDASPSEQERGFRYVGEALVGSKPFA